MSNDILLMAFDMEPHHLDEQMELGTSPVRPIDDIDFEDLDPVNNPSVDNSMLDEVEFSARDNDAMQADIEDMYRDDEMLDDQDKTNAESSNIMEINMDDKSNIEEVEEEILYDDDTVEEHETTTDQAFSIDDVKKEESDTIAFFQEADDTKEFPTVSTREGSNVTNFAEDIIKISEQNGTISETAVTDPGDDIPEHPQYEDDNLYQENQIVESNVVDFAHDVDAQQATGSRDDTSAESEVAEKLESTLDEDLDEATNEEAADSTSRDDGTIIVGKANDEVTGHGVQSHRPSNELDSAPDFELQRELRSIKMNYLGEAMSLFPPTEADPATTFFLSDPDLASDTLEKLLFSCREILGESLGHEDELVLDFPALGLHITEDSKYASSLTLSQVVGIYRQLCQNDKDVTSEPLYCSLSSRVCLATQFIYLSDAAQDGRSFSEIAADYIDSPGPGENFNDHMKEEREEENMQTSAEDMLNSNLDVRESEAHDPPADIEGQPSVSSPPKASPTQDEQSGDLEETDAHVEFGGDDPEQVDNQPTIEGHSTLPEHLSEDEEAENEDDLAQSTYDPQEDVFAQDEVDLESTGGPNGLDIQPDLPLDSETSSSHTVQADHVNLYRLESIEDEEELGEGDDPEHVNFSVELDGHERSIPAEFDNPAQDETRTDLLDHSWEHETREDAILDTDIFVEAPRDEHHYPGDPDDGQATTNGLQAFIGQDANPELSGLEDNTTPVTPSKQSSSKRKAIEDDEELDFLDLSTPEPKRSRPS